MYAACALGGEQAERRRNMTAENTHAHAASSAPVAPSPGQATTTPTAPPVPPAPPAPPAGSGRKQRRQGRKRRGWWGFLVDRGTELLAAILTLVAAVLGIWGAQLNNENDELSARVDTLQDTGSVLRDDNASLTEDLADMTTSRDSWKERAEAAEKDDGTSSTPGTTTPDAVDPDDPPGDITPGAAGIFRQTGASPVTFAVNYGIDLDSQEANWSVGDSGGDVYLYRATNGYYIATSGQVALVSQEASYEQCDAQTVLQSDLTKEQTVVGRQFCMVTSERRWAYVKIVGLDTERETVTLHVVVYSLEND